MSQPQIVDGLTIKSCVRFLPNRFAALALGQLGAFRLAASEGYKLKIHTVPTDVNEPVAAASHSFYQVEVPAGSYLWAYAFNVSSGSPTALWFNVREACNDIGLFKELINGSLNAVNQTSGATAPMQNPVILSEPRPIIEPGLLDVDIANGGNASVSCQLALMFFIPLEEYGRFYGNHLH